MPLESFANMIFEVTRRDCKNLKDFEAFLKKEIPQDLEKTAKKALQDLQCPDRN